MLVVLVTVKLKRARLMRKMGNFTVASHAPMTDALPIPDTTVAVVVPANLMSHHIQMISKSDVQTFENIHSPLSPGVN